MSKNKKNKTAENAPETENKETVFREPESEQNQDFQNTENDSNPESFAENPEDLAEDNSGDGESGEAETPDTESDNTEGADFEDDSAQSEEETENKETKEDEFIRLVEEVSARFGAVSSKIEGEEKIIKLFDEEGGEIDSGTIEELNKIADEMELDALKPKHINPSEMKVRWRKFTRRLVVRAIIDFEYDGVQYKAGDVFDWAGLGLKPYQIARLYSRRMIRHIQQDTRVPYPFRLSRPIVSETPKEIEGETTETNLEDSKPDAEKSQAEEKAVKSGRKFTRAGE